MRNLLLSSVLLTFLGFNLNSQITPNGNSGASTTVYTNGAPNDPIYIWCAEGLANNTASLTATSPSGSGPFTYNWFYHNQVSFSWEPYTSFVGASSTISSLASDGYRVQIYDNGGALVNCYIAWVWNMNGDVTASNVPTACNASNLSGTVSSNGSFSYYNPPPAESLITASTQFNICFTAAHSYVSDLGFYLVGPAACGSPLISLSPNPGSIGQGPVCNSGDNISNLCFSSVSASILNVCTAAVPLSGTYGGYGAGAGTMINWAPLIGCNAAEGGWAVQIYDCIGADVGVLTNANISFSNLTSVCGSPTSINYSSGAIASVIYDNSCSAATASIFQVPVTNNLTTPITVNATTSYLWTSAPVIAIPNASSSLTPAVASLPNGNTMFYLTASVSYGTANCSYVDSTSFTNTCCTAVANAGGDVSFCTGSNAQIGTAALTNMTYSWSPGTGLNNATLAQPTVALSNGGATPQTTVYTLTVTNVLDGGCTATDDVNVTVNPIPTVNAGTYPIVCSDGANVTLVGSPVGGTFSGIGVTGNSFAPSSGAQTITYNYTDVNTCSNTATALINVVVVSIINAGTYGPVCTGTGNIALVGSPLGGTFSGAGVTGNSFNPASGTQLITYSYSDAFGCSGSATTTITVNPLPVVTAGVYAAVCVDAANVPLVGTPAGGTFSGTGVAANSFDPSVGTQTVTYTYTNGNGCTNTATSALTVNPLPVVTAGVYSAVCTDAANVPLLGTPAGGAFSGTGVAANSFDPSVGTQTVTYIYTNGNGCTNTATASILVNPLPTIAAGSDQTICLETSISLSGTGGTSYSWTGGAINGQSFAPGLGSTSYTVTGTDANGCVNTDIVTITVLILPVAVLNSDVTTGYPTLTVNFTNTSLNATSYLWSFGNGNIANASNTAGQTVSYSSPGTYQVLLSASNGVCNDVDTLLIIVIPFSPPIVHAPNVFTPNGDGTNDFFFIETILATTINVIIFNRWGEVIQEQTDFTMKWDGQVNGKDASEGVYFFKYEVTGLNGDVLIGHGNITLLR